MMRPPIWGVATLLLVIGASGCAPGRGITPSPSFSPGAETRWAPQAITPSSSATTTSEAVEGTPTPPFTFTPPVAVEGKPTPPGGKKPWTPPPTFTLPPPRTSWQVYELPEAGIRLQVPSEWKVFRQPGAYRVVVTGEGEYYEERVMVTFCCVELPRTLPEFQEAIGPYWRTLHAENFVVKPLQGKGWQGVAVWHLPNICLDVYIPSPEIVRQITFWPILCEPDGEHLVPLGQKILDSIEIFPPSGEWK
jgi:hypothetical protein